MKLTIEQIKKLINEELKNLMDEGVKLAHRKRAIKVKHNGVTVDIIPLSLEEFVDYKKQGFFKHLGAMKDKGQQGKHLNPEDFLPENLTGYYEVIEDKPLHNAAKAASSKGMSEERYLAVLDGDKEVMKKIFIALYEDLAVTPQVVEVLDV